MALLPWKPSPQTDKHQGRRAARAAVCPFCAKCLPRRAKKDKSGMSPLGHGTDFRSAAAPGEEHLQTIARLGISGDHIGGDDAGAASSCFRNPSTMVPTEEGLTSRLVLIVARQAATSNGHSKPDLAVENDMNNVVSIFLGNRRSAFFSAMNVPAGTHPHSVAMC